MGLNNENAQLLIFDIETAPLEDAEQYLEPAEAPAHYKNPETIERYLREKEAEQLARCALDLDLCRIVTIAVQAEDSQQTQVGTVEHGSEAALLEWFWERALDRHLVGFNILGFDLPVLLRRSLYLGVSAPQVVLDKYRHPGITDLALMLSHNGQHKMRSLGFYCKRFGVTVEDAVSGADIPRLVQAGLWAEVIAHCRADVGKTVALGQAMRLIRPSVGPQAGSLLKH